MNIYVFMTKYTFHSYDKHALKKALDVILVYKFKSI